METRTCNRCQQFKTLDQFYLRPNGKPRSYCIQCIAVRSDERRKANPDRFKRNAYWTLFRVDFDQLWESQQGLCAACHHPMLRNGKQPDSVVVDHNHACCPDKGSCGKCVRGLLHYKCNMILGYANDDPAKIDAVIKYLENWSVGKAARYA